MYSLEYPCLAVLTLLTVIFGVARFFVPVRGIDTRDFYKDFAHIFVGILCGAWLVTYDVRVLGLFLAITAVEVVAFFVRKAK
jgi:hypothetical protein